ncbi:MAG: hypothetical protein AAGD07_09585 [Planctomycetota bacterium]
MSKKRYDVTMDNAGGPTYFSVADRNRNVLHEGVTPQQVSLDAKAFPYWPATYHVTFAGNQDNSEVKTVKAGWDNWLVGNILLGGVTGLVVDGATGAAFKLPSRVEGGIQQQFAVTDVKQGAMIASNRRTQDVPVTEPAVTLAERTGTPLVQTAAARLPADNPASADVQLASEPAKKGFWPFR